MSEIDYSRPIDEASNALKHPSRIAQEGGTTTIEIPLVSMRKDQWVKRQRQLFGAGAAAAFALVAFVSHYGQDPKASAATPPTTQLVQATTTTLAPTTTTTVPKD